MTPVGPLPPPEVAALAFEAPLFLLLLALPPLLWWLHRREPQPVAVVVPSLRFFADEAPAPERAERRRVDAELVLSLLAAAALALAAAGPVFTSARDGRRITVLVDGGPAMDARASDGTTAGARARAIAEAVRRAADDADDVTVVTAFGDDLARRTRDASTGLVLLASDRRPRDVPAGVVFVGVGDPAATNAGIVAVDVETAPAGRKVYATVWNDAAAARRLRAGPVGAETDLDLPAFGAARGAWDLPPAPVTGTTATTLHVEDPRGALAVDDDVVLDPSPLLVGFGRPPASAPDRLVAALRQALDAAMPGGWREASAPTGGLFVGPRRLAPAAVAVVLEVDVVPAGAEPVRPGKGARFSPADLAAARDLDLDACEWVFREAPALGASWPRVTVERGAGASPAAPIVVCWHGDPTLGRPAALDTALWPLFVENVVRLARGEPGPAGHRVVGTLDPEVSRLGRDVVPLDPRVLDAAPRDARARRLPLRGPAALAAVLALAWLWIRPRGSPAVRTAAPRAR